MSCTRLAVQGTKEESAMNKFLLILLMLFVFASSCKKNDYQEMRVYPVPEGVTAVQGGEQFIALQVELPPRTHIYGNPKGPGTGKPTEVTVKKEDGIVFRKQQFLPPEKFFFSGEKEYTWGYENNTRIFIPFRVTESARTGVHRVEITFDSLLCSDAAGSSSCTPKLFQIAYPVRVLDKGSAPSVHADDIISDYKRSASPAGEKKKDDAAPLVTIADDGDFPRDLSFSPRYIDRGVSGIIQAILFGIIAGFLLNFMPCVLPVVSLKVMSFVQHADKSRKELLLLGLLFSFGILTSFAVLAVLAAFFGYGWGGLFQNRLFLVVMTGIVFALALSMFGVFVIQAPAFAGRAVKDRGNHYADAYIKGLFATLLATPCSGPFLGATLAWTATRPAPVIVTVFMCIGFGMALPYLLLTIRPGLLKYVPRPGEWLVTFERVMGFLLIFTVIYLLTIFEQSSILPMITFLGLLSAGLWLYGRYGAIYQPAAKRIFAVMILLLVAIGGYHVSFYYLYEGKRTAGAVQHNAFSIARLMENRQTGKISVIEFTADWCPNCRLVEKISLQADAVREEFRKGDIDVMVADITVKNPHAERLMALFQSNSIPLLAIVPPGKSFDAPVILRDIYSKDDIMDALEIAREAFGQKNGFQYQFDIQKGR